MTTHRVEREIAGRTLSIETGKIAKQADGAVLVQYGETVVLGTAVRAAPREGIDFFPLTVDYREKLPAAGKFPGGFRKREGAPEPAKKSSPCGTSTGPFGRCSPRATWTRCRSSAGSWPYDGQNEPDVLAGIAASRRPVHQLDPLPGPGRQRARRPRR